MRLYGSYTSPYVRHCRVALLQEGVDFDFVETDYAMSAEKSPAGKVPFFTDGDLTLTDSSSILKYVREKSGGNFLAEIQDYENFALTNTVLDTTINLFLMEKDGFGPDQVPYLGRQKNRMQSGLKELNTRFDPARGVTTDSALRCACFVGWGLFRKRIDIDDLGNLRGLLDAANKIEPFAATAPPG